MPREIPKVCTLWKLKAENKSGVRKERERVRRSRGAASIGCCRNLQQCLSAFSTGRPRVFVWDREESRSWCPRRSQESRGRRDKAVHLCRISPRSACRSGGECRCAAPVRLTVTWGDGCWRTHRWRGPRGLIDNRGARHACFDSHEALLSVSEEQPESEVPATIHPVLSAQVCERDSITKSLREHANNPNYTQWWNKWEETVLKGIMH